MSRLLLSRKLSVSEPSPTLDEGLLQTAGRVLPPSEYRAMLLEVTPELVRPGEQTDYFTHEQVELWGIDSFWKWGIPFAQVSDQSPCSEALEALPPSSLPRQSA